MEGTLGEGEGRDGGAGSIEEGGGALISTVMFPAVTSHRKTAQEVESDRDALGLDEVTGGRAGGRAGEGGGVGRLMEGKTGRNG